MKRNPTIAISATFTAQQLCDVAAFWIAELRVPWRIELAPYNQVFQQLLDAGSILRRTGNLCNAIFVRLQDLAGIELGPDRVAASPEEVSLSLQRSTDDLVSYLKSATSESATPYLLFLCPDSPDLRTDANLGRSFTEARARLIARLSPTNRVSVLDHSDVTARYPVTAFDDSAADELGHIPFTPTYFAALGTVLIRRIHAMVREPTKVIALDCDGTLWSGVVAEDGVDGLDIDQHRAHLQQSMLDQRSAGRLLCVCSKNRLEDVLEVFDNHPDMLLRREHIASWRVNWAPKSMNLRSIAEELGLGLASFVLVDDNPVERAEVNANSSQVLTVGLPSAGAGEYLDHVWAFDRTPTTAEDSKRTEFYRLERKRTALKERAPSLEEFLASLELEAAITPITSHQIPRVSQLSYRTNQFNLSGIRRSESDIEQALRDPNCLCLVAEVKDRFGDYGLVGVMICIIRSDRIDLDSFLLSCRALGRSVEFRMLARVGVEAVSRGLKKVGLRLARTARNGPIVDFLELAARQLAATRGDDGYYEFSASTLRELDPIRLAVQPASFHSEVMRQSDEEGSNDAQTGTSDQWNVIRRVAAELRTAEAIERAVRDHRQRRTQLDRQVDFVAPSGSTEEAVAGIWSNVLGVSTVGASDNFFSLGGESITATQVLTRIREAFGIEVSFPQFFNASNVKELARVINGATANDGARDRPATTPLQSHPVREGWSETGIAVPATEGQQDESGVEFHVVEREVPQEEPPPPSGISTLAISTCNRPRALARSLASYSKNCQEHGRALPYLVVDDSRDESARAENRRALDSVGDRAALRILYSGLEEKLRFVETLDLEGIPRHVAEFALLGDDRVEVSHGANQNAARLATAGELVFVADDDTVCHVAVPDGSSSDLVGVRGSDPCTYRFFESRSEALQSVSYVNRGILEQHEQLLGRGVIAGDDGVTGVGGMSDPLEARAAEPHHGGKIGMTSTGLVGDCGWGAPFGYWAAPMGCLLLDDDGSHERMIRTEDSYRAACTSRDILRVAVSNVVADTTFSMSTFCGYDNRDLLPPFMPVARGADVVFGRTLELCLPTTRFGHLPLALVHDPLEERRFWPGEVFRTAAALDFAKLTLACMGSWDPPTENNDGRHRLVALGSHLMELGSLPVADFDAHLVQQVQHRYETFRRMVESKLEARPSAPRYWVDDVTHYLELAKAALANRDSLVALDLQQGVDRANLRRLQQEMVYRFGELCVAWQDIVRTAKRLREAGVRPCRAL